ncbi:MAG: hypothetical protein WCB68_17635 [Pyrinomonadaceae bacterium]
MYCSSCGVAVAQSLTYCKHCGAKLNGAKSGSVSRQAELFPESLIWAIVSVFVVGVGCVIGLIAVMKTYGLNEGLINGFAATIFLMMIAIESIFIWMLLSRSRRATEVSDTALPKEHATQELDAAQERLLPEPLQSVTENTTRSFEPIYSERKSK